MVDTGLESERKRGEELRLYNDGTNDGVHIRGPQSLRNGLLPLDLAKAKVFIRYHITPSEGVLDKEGRVPVEYTVAFAE